MTLDRDGHLLPGSAQVALGLLREFVAKKLRSLNRKYRLKARLPTGESARWTLKARWTTSACS